jgi:hypothetical protein
MDVICPQCGAKVTARADAAGDVSLIDPTPELGSKCPIVQARPFPRSVDDYICSTLANAVGHAVMRNRP